MKARMTTPSHAPSVGETYRSSAFIATSLDGFIARTDGDITWLTSRAQDAGPTGYEDFMAGTDTAVTGRSTYEMATSFGPDQWPYEGKNVIVLSTRLRPGADPRITVCRDLDEVRQALAEVNAKHVYVDGGQTIRSFLRAGMLNDITITTTPVLLGTGLPLFGPLDGEVTLTHRSTTVLGAGFVQSTYTVETRQGAGAFDAMR
jgi:dihydrofolate reductase